MIKLINKIRRRRYLRALSCFAFGLLVIQVVIFKKKLRRNFVCFIGQSRIVSFSFQKTRY